MKDYLQSAYSLAFNSFAPCLSSPRIIHDTNGIPLESVEKMRTQLGLGSSQSGIVVYPDAPHAFFADYRPSYRETDAIDGWNRLQTWFKQYEVG
jgi:dienelactone hydrolase